MSLRTKLEEEVSHLGFISISALRLLVTPDSVASCLQNILERDSPFFDTVVEKYSKIFALLVVEGVEGNIVEHLTEQVQDGRFPFLREEEVPNLPIGMEKEAVFRSQWKIPPVLEKSTHLDLPPGFIAPFIGRQDIAHGAFGFVYKTRVAEGHLPDYPPNMPVALKRIRKLDQDKWEIMMREVETLRARQHPNIIQLLASFTERDIESNFEALHLNLLFPYAEMDMYKWLNLTATPESRFGIRDTHQRKEYIYSTIASLVDALSYLHREQDGIITSHHDLKPRNILLVGETWKIADFGRTHLIRLKDGSETEAQKPLGTFEYNPPEYWDDVGRRANVRHGRGFDIWAIGCITIELLTIAVYGWSPNRVTEFRQSRKKNDVKRKVFRSVEYPQDDDSFHNNMNVVQSFIVDLRRVDGSSRLIDLLELGARMLNEDVNQRPFAWEISLDLYEILNPNATTAERTERTKATAQRPSPGDANERRSALERAVVQGNVVRIKCLLDLGWVVRGVGDRSLRNCSLEVLEILQAASTKGVLLQARRHSKGPLRLRANVEAHHMARPSTTSGVYESVPAAPSFDLEIEPFITKFHAACRENNMWTIANILEKFPSGFRRAKILCSTDVRRRVPLHHASRHCSSSVLSILTVDFAFGASSTFHPAAMIRRQDSMGRTPLHAAAQGNNVEAVQHLLDLDTDTQAFVLMLDDEWETAWDLAVKYRHWEAAEALAPIEREAAFGTSKVVGFA